MENSTYMLCVNLLRVHSWNTAKSTHWRNHTGTYRFAYWSRFAIPRTVCHRIYAAEHWKPTNNAHAHTHKKKPKQTHTLNISCGHRRVAPHRIKRPFETWEQSTDGTNGTKAPLAHAGRLVAVASSLCCEHFLRLSVDARTNRVGKNTTLNGTRLRHTERVTKWKPVHECLCTTVWVCVRWMMDRTKWKSSNSCTYTPASVFGVVVFCGWSQWVLKASRRQI